MILRVGQQTALRFRSFQWQTIGYSTAALKWTGGIQNCLTISLDYDRDVQNDRDISATNQFMLTMNFKYLGSITQNDLFKGNDNK